MSDELTIIATFTDVLNAHIARSKLESEGIPCFLMNERFVHTYWLYSNATGGVKLSVQQSDVEKAKAILRTVSVDETPEDQEVLENEPQIQCPKCSSPEVYYERFSRKLVFLSLLFLGIPLPFLRRKWKCQNCGWLWKAR